LNVEPEGRFPAEYVTVLLSGSFEDSVKVSRAFSLTDFEPMELKVGGLFPGSVTVPLFEISVEKSLLPPDHMRSHRN